MRSSGARHNLLGGRSVAAILTALCTSLAPTASSGQQVIPFGDVPATPDFTEQEIAARGQQQARNLTFSDWTKLCFRGVEGAGTKMVCRQMGHRSDRPQGRSDRTRRYRGYQAADFRSAGIVLAARHEANRRQEQLDEYSLHDLRCQWLCGGVGCRRELCPRTGVGASAVPRGCQCKRRYRHDPAATRQLCQSLPESACANF